MKKNDIDKILEAQRKNLRFVGEDSDTKKTSGNSKFVTVDSQPQVINPVPKMVFSQEAAASAVKKSEKVGTYLDIRKLKLERRRLAQEQQEKQEQRAEQIEEVDEPELDDADDDKFGVDFVLSKQKAAIDNARAKANGETKKFDPLGSKAVGYKFLPNEVPVPEPAAVRTKRRLSARKIDDDLVDKKIFNTYFDDLLD